MNLAVAKASSEDKLSATLKCEAAHNIFKAVQNIIQRSIEHNPKRLHATNIGHLTLNEVPFFSLSNQELYVYEPCFTQMALNANLIDLIYIGCELCGAYSIDPISKELLNRKPRTKVAFLQAYLQKAEEIRGRAKAHPP